MPEDQVPTPDEPSAATTPEEAARRDEGSWEERQPPAQRWLNRFCENWIFAFIVAMAIRQFALEAYQIPTASMEPMLYGDGAFGKADYVLVDKLLFRFTGADRWGVTVFQFPWPEVAGSEGIQRPDPAWNAEGERVDNFPFNPLLYRNFVKRCVVKPGDEFYFSGGDLYLRQEDGSWQVPVKPDDVQEALWLPIYRQGAQVDNDRWAATGGAGFESEGDTLTCRLGDGGEIAFDQPFWNLYLKPGPVNVGRPGGAPSQVDVSMIQPRFDLGRGVRGQGSIWDLGRWEVRRLTTSDLDSQNHGAVLNQRMTEWVGDLRIGFVPSVVEGAPELVLQEGAAVDIRLRFAPEGWRLTVDGSEVAAGAGDPTGVPFELVNVDNRVILSVAGEAQHPPVAVAPTDPTSLDHRSTLRWTGTGSIRVEGFAIDRDVHYSAAGFLADEGEAWRQPPDQTYRQNLVVLRRQMIAALVDEDLRSTLLADLEAGLAGRRSYDWLAPIGTGPETALRAPEGGYLLLGDNSPFSWDGRNWGWVPEVNLRGQVLLAALLPIGRWKVVD